MAFVLVQHGNSGALVSASGTAPQKAFGVAVTSGNNVRGWVTWGTAVAGDLISVTDNKSNTYTISDKILGTTNNQSLASFHKENITNAPTTITANITGGIGACGIIIEEWSGEDNSGTAINAHGGQRQVSPGTGTDAVSSGNITTNVDGCNICGAAMDVNFVGTALGVGTGETLSDDYYTDAKCKSESETQPTQGNVAATFTLIGSSNETLAVAMAAVPAAGGAAFPGLLSVPLTLVIV